MPVYSAPPQKYDYEHIVGDTFNSGTRTLQDSTGTAYDITGASGSIQIRTEPGGALVASGSFSLDDAANGVYSWSIAAATTAAITPDTYRYAERLTFSGGEIKTIVEGKITFKASVAG